MDIMDQKMQEQMEAGEYQYDHFVNQLVALLKESEKHVFDDHPHKKELFRQLESGELEKRMKIIGEHIFDPSGRVRWLIAMRKLID